MKKLVTISILFCLVLFIANSVPAETLHSKINNSRNESSFIVVAETQYTKGEIIEYFTKAAKRKTRSIPARRTLDNITFEHNSVALTAQAKRELDEWGSALTDSAMVQMVFKVAGHTDDVGSESYNYELSRKRASAVKSYLVSKFNVAYERLL